jgi:hypothetical protein
MRIIIEIDSMAQAMTVHQVTTAPGSMPVADAGPPPSALVSDMQGRDVRGARVLMDGGPPPMELMAELGGRGADVADAGAGPRGHRP